MASSGKRDLMVRGLSGAALAAVLLATGASAAGPGAGAPAPPASAPAAVHEVVVEGQAPKAVRERQLQAFVTRVPARNNGEGLARWTTPICPVVVGMTEQQGEYVLARIVQVARAAGAPVIDDGRCEADLYIVASADPGGLVKALGRRSPGVFATAPAAEVRRFLETPRPVRAWYKARLDRLTTGIDSPFEGLPGLASNVPVIHHAVDTRLSTNSPYALAVAIVVVDSGRVEGFKVGALADYLAMASLAQLQPDADVGGAPSILNLFSAAEANRPQGLTGWDAAFLHALYHTPMEDRHQASAIAARMDKDIAHGDPGR